jgi:hypothetical protein
MQEPPPQRRLLKFFNPLGPDLRRGDGVEAAAFAVSFHTHRCVGVMEWL